MNVRTEDLPQCQVKISVTFDVEEVNGSFEKVYKELNQAGRVRGFRPGMAPKALLARFYGEEAIRSSAWYDLLQDHLEKALAEMGLLGQPELPKFEDIEFAEGEPSDLEFIGTVGPRVKLGDFGDLTLVRPSAESTEEEVGEVLAKLQDSHAEEAEVERDTVQPGDAVDLEMTITAAGEEEAVNEAEETVIVGAGTNVPPIDEKLPGRIVGQTVEMDFTYPDDYHDESLAGKEVHIAAKIAALRERRVPELSDEFAQKVDEDKFPTLEDLKAEIKRQSDEQKAEYSRQELESQILKALMERSEVELPEVLVEGMAQREMHSLTHELEEMGMDLAAFQDMAGVSDDDLAARHRARAEQLLKINAIIEEKGKEIGDPTDDEVEAEMAAYAEEHGLDPNQVKQAAEVQEQFTDQLSERMKRRRVFDSIIETASIEDVSVAEYEARREALLTVADEAEQDEAEQSEESESPEGEPTAETDSDSDAAADADTEAPEAEE